MPRPGWVTTRPLTLAGISYCRRRAGEIGDLFTPTTLLSGFTPGGRFYAGDSVFTYGSDNVLRDCSTSSCGGFNRSDIGWRALG